jgi:hypothetical protein
MRSKVGAGCVGTSSEPGTHIGLWRGKLKAPFLQPDVGIFIFFAKDGNKNRFLAVLGAWPVSFSSRLPCSPSYR